MTRPMNGKHWIPSDDTNINGGAILNLGEAVLIRNGVRDSTGEIREDIWSRGVGLTAAQVDRISRLVNGLYQCADCWCWFCREGDKPLVCPACGASYEEADDEAQTP